MTARRSIALSVAVIAAVAGTTFAGRPVQPGPGGFTDVDIAVAPPGAPVHAGESVVRVTPRTARELAAALALSEELWSERTGVGAPLDIQVTADGIAALREMGLDPQVRIDDVQTLLDDEWARLVTSAVQRDQMPAGQRDIAFFQDYQQLGALTNYIENLAVQRPDLASIEVVGTSLEGRDITAIHITGPDAPGNAAADRPIILWTGCQHAREWISPMTVTYMADRLVSLYDTDARVHAILDQAEIIIVPVVNPDGYAYTWQSSSTRLWRKNRRGGYGVDLNRNWGYQWGGVGSSGSTSSETYRGTAPFSEPETAAVRDYAIALGDRLISHIDYHSYSQLVLWPFGYDYVDAPEPDKTFFETLGIDMSDEMIAAGGVFYDPIRSSDLYPAAGDITDWMYGVLGKYSYTIELRDTGNFGFVLPANQILPTAQENYAAALVFAERTTTPLSLRFDDVPTEIEANVATPISIEVNSGVESATTSATLYTSIDGGAFSATPLTASLVGDGSAVFNTTLPAVACGAELAYYVEATSAEGTTIRLPHGGAAEPFIATASERENRVYESFETNTGWTVGGPSDTASTGQWERANPQGTAAQPEDDTTPTGTLCYVTGASAGTSIGSFDIDGGITTLTSPVFDATESGGQDAYLIYERWYSNNLGASPNEDSMLIEVSSNGGSSWTLLEEVSENLGAWTEKSFRIADYVTPTSNFRVRFIARDLGDGSVVEAAIDDVRVEMRGCSGPMPINGADLAAPFGVLNFADVQAFLGAFGSQQSPADLAAPFGTYNFADVQAFLGLFGQG